jgi:hypothetical protein
VVINGIIVSDQAGDDKGIRIRAAVDSLTSVASLKASIGGGEGVGGGSGGGASVGGLAAVLAARRNASAVQG